MSRTLTQLFAVTYMFLTGSVHLVEAGSAPTWEAFHTPGVTCRKSPAIAFSPDGGINAVVTTSLANETSIDVLHIDSGGHVSLVVRAVDPGINCESQPGLAVFPGGEVVVATRSSSGVVVRGYSASGSSLFTTPLPEAMNQITFLDHIGPVLVRGDDDHCYVGAEGDGDFVTAKISLTGEVLWTRVFSNPDAEIQSPTDIVYDESGLVTVAGVAFQGMPVVQYGTDGNLEWSAIVRGFETPSVEFSLLLGDTYVANGSGGSIVVAGNPESGCGQTEIVLARFDGSGKSLGDQFVPPDCLEGFPSTTMEARGVAVAANGDISLVANGNHLHENFWRIHVYRFDMNGSELWHENYDAAGSIDFAGGGGAVDAFGRVHVAGSTNITDDLVMVSYDTGGDVALSAEWDNGASNNRATDILVDRAGSVTLAGTTQGDAVFLRFDVPLPGGVPAVSAWGVVVAVLLTAATGTLICVRVGIFGRVGGG